MLQAAHDGMDVTFRAGEGDLVHEGRAVGDGGAMPPLENVGAAGVVIREGEREGVVRLRVAFEEFLQIPRAGEGVGGGIEEGIGRETGDALGAGPFAGGGGADLHETILTGAAALIWAESAFVPDDGLDEGGFDAVTARGGKDGDVLAVVAPLVPPPPAADSREKQEEG